MRVINANIKGAKSVNADQKTASNSFFQPKLTVNQPNDVYEQEADTMADQVMRMTDTSYNQNAFFKPANTAVQRKCQHCEEEEKKVHRKESSGNEIQGGHQLDSYVSSLSSSGQPMPEGSRKFFEPRFGHDFSSVRIHNDSVAAKSAQSINALAYTTGTNIVFNNGQYSPDGDNGKKLLAHELTHVVQQRNNFTGVQRLLQRKLTINPADSVPMPAGVQGPPTPLTHAVQRLLNDLCLDGQPQVDRGTGEVTLADPSFCEDWFIPMRPDIKRVNNTATPAGCRCLCDVINDPQTTTVQFSPGGPSTGPGSQAGPGPVPGQGGLPTDSRVSIDPRFQGQYRINGNWVDVPFYLLFSHELCGHALPKMQGTHAARGAGPAGGTPPQERHAVDVERDIATEHAEPRRPEDYSGDARQRP